MKAPQTGKIILWGLLAILLVMSIIIAFYEPKPNLVFTAQRVSGSQLEISVRNAGPYILEGEILFNIHNRLWRKRKFSVDPGKVYAFDYKGANENIQYVLLLTENALYERILSWGLK